MRTTLTLDEDVARLVEEEQHRTRSSMKEIVNAALRDIGTGGNLTTDAQIAGLAIEWDATVCSNDADFGRFPGVKWTNPLAGRPRRVRRPWPGPRGGLR